MQSTLARAQGIFLLVIEKDPQRQEEIKHGLMACMPRLKIKFTASPDETLSWLPTWLVDQVAVVNLLLLDLDLPDPASGLALLHTLRTTYPYLPIAVFSTDQRPDTVLQVYDSGASSFIKVPTDSGWQQSFKTLAEYWLKTAVLPTRP